MTTTKILMTLALSSLAVTPLVAQGSPNREKPLPLEAAPMIVAAA